MQLLFGFMGFWDISIECNIFWTFYEGEIVIKGVLFAHTQQNSPDYITGAFV
jgi:hypothetical protein